MEKDIEEKDTQNIQVTEPQTSEVVEQKQVSAPQEKEPQKTQPSKNKKKKPFILRFFKLIFSIILTLFLLLTIWFTFCFFNKVDNLSALPSNFSAYIRTDSVWNAVEPILDLKAADILLADEPLLTFRETFLSLRESDLRNNFLVSYALSRRIDAALYNSEDSKEATYLGIVDMGLLSGGTRLLPLLYRFFSIPNLIYVMSGSDSCFEYNLESMILYIKPYKNLVIVSNDKNLLHSSIAIDNTTTFSKSELTLLKQPLTQPFRITADGNKLLSLFQSDNQYIQTLTQSISTKNLSEINFGITDENINIGIKIPFSVDETNSDDALVKLIQKDSKLPVLINKLPESVQYYTFLTAGNLSELKEAAFSILSDKPDLEKKWRDANNISKMVFKETLDEILFSWTSDEYAVLGIEGKAEPVFAIKIADEVKRQYIFDTILSSIVFKANNSLLLDGIRMPRIEFPVFLQSLLEAFKINLPKPYYMVKDGFVYFSQSPENLALINASIKSGAKINKNENWQKVSGKQNPQSSVSLFYDLERSIPFFIKNKSIISEILKLYNIGRVDVMTQNQTLYLTLQASAYESASTKDIPGFPINLEGKVVPVLHKSNNTKSKMLFWQENNSVKAINISNFEVSTKEINNLFSIIQNANPSDENELWALTKDGNVYLFNGKLEVAENFPIITGEAPTSNPAVFNNKIIFFAADGELISVNTNGEITKSSIDVMNDIKSTPVVFEDSIAVYEKGFLGTIHLLSEQNNVLSEKSIIDVEGIAYGSPNFIKVNNQKYIGFITQSGDFSIWDSNNNLVEGFPVSVDGIFYTNVKSCNDFFVALSEDGTIYKLELSGKVTSVKIPYLTAKNNYITIYDYDDDNSMEIFICGDSNIIYGLNKDFEYLNNFPLSGFGEIEFADVNGDKISDCITLSIDNKLNAWKVR